MFEIVRETQSRWFPGHVQHINRDGARYHVISWSSENGRTVRRCSTKNCEINAEHVAR